MGSDSRPSRVKLYQLFKLLYPGIRQYEARAERQFSAHENARVLLAYLRRHNAGDAKRVLEKIVKAGMPRDDGPDWWGYGTGLAWDRRSMQATWPNRALP